MVTSAFSGSIVVGGGVFSAACVAAVVCARLKQRGAWNVVCRFAHSAVMGRAWAVSIGKVEAIDRRVAAGAVLGKVAAGVAALPGC